MDPISFGLAIGAALTQSAILYKRLKDFSNNTKTIGETVKELLREIASLKTALNAAKLSLENKLVYEAEDYTDNEEGLDFWEGVGVSITDCNITLQSLDSLLEKLIPEQNSIGAQAWRTIKLELRDSEIQRLKGRVRTHISSLQMVIQTITLRATYLTPGVVVDTLTPKIEDLRAAVEDLNMDIRQKKNEYNIDPNNNEFTKEILGESDQEGSNINSTESESVKKLQITAKRVLSSAVTACGTSNDDVSIVGEKMDPLKRQRTFSWIPPVPEEKFPINLTASPNSTRINPSPQTMGIKDFTPASSYTTYDDDHTFLKDDDSDSDFDSEMFLKCFKKGLDEFKNTNYATAQKLLNKGLDRSKRLSMTKRKPLNISQAQFMVAACAYYLCDLDRAAQLLIIVTQGEADTREEADIWCRARHLLACTYYSQKQYSAAEKACNEARKARRLNLGKNHRDYFESLNLLANIYRAQESREDEAAMIEEMIPNELIDTFAPITPWSSDAQKAPEIILPPPLLVSEKPDEKLSEKPYEKPEEKLERSMTRNSSQDDNKDNSSATRKLSFSTVISNNPSETSHSPEKESRKSPIVKGKWPSRRKSSSSSKHEVENSNVILGTSPESNRFKLNLRSSWNQKRRSVPVDSLLLEEENAENSIEGKPGNEKDKNMKRRQTTQAVLDPSTVDSPFLKWALENYEDSGDSGMDFFPRGLVFQ